jgi:crossover junction endodeoxyribonuclease RuvC
VGISLQQFEQMKGRVAGRRRTAAPVLEAAAPAKRPSHRVVLGLDPSLRGTGYGVVQFTGPQARCLAQGTIRCPAGWPRSRCLALIAQTLRELVRVQRPTVGVIEGLFYAQNLQTALTMGEARGACLAAVAQAGLDIYELAPRRVKQAIVGYGAAQKLAVAKMVQRMLKLPELPEPDAADALALALAHAQAAGRYSLNPPRAV